MMNIAYAPNIPQSLHKCTDYQNTCKTRHINAARGPLTVAMWQKKPGQAHHFFSNENKYLERTFHFHKKISQVLVQGRSPSRFKINAVC